MVDEILQNNDKGTEELSYLPSADIGDFFLREIRSREKFILEMGGETVKYLKRRFEGTKCSVCWDEVRQQAENDCISCFGTGIVGGYYDVLDIKVSLVNPAVKQITMQDHGMKSIIQPKSWTIWEPEISNKDIFVTKMNKRFWIVNVTPSLWRGLILRQSFDTELIEQSNIIYKIPVG